MWHATHPHCALRRTLDVVCQIHNENILARVLIAAFVLRPVPNLPNFEIAGAQRRVEPELTGVRTMSSRFTQFILIAMVLGIVVGALVFNLLPDNRAEIASSVNLIAMLILRLIKMIIARLVCATLVGGIAHMGSVSKLGRVFAKTLGW